MQTSPSTPLPAASLIPAGDSDGKIEADAHNQQQQQQARSEDVTFRPIVRPPLNPLSPTMRDTEEESTRATENGPDDATVQPAPATEQPIASDSAAQPAIASTSAPPAALTSPGGSATMSVKEEPTAASAPVKKAEEPSLLTGEPAAPADPTVKSESKAKREGDGQAIHADSDDESDEDGHSSAHTKGESVDLTALGDISHLTPLQQFHLKQKLKKEKGVSCHRQWPRACGWSSGSVCCCRAHRPLSLPLLLLVQSARRRRTAACCCSA